MGNKIVTEADRKATPAPKPMEGYTLRRNGGGQKISLERGKATRSKKNAGKRPHKGGWFAHLHAAVRLRGLPLAGPLLLRHGKIGLSPRTLSP